MRFSTFVLACSALLLASSAFAQKGELYGDYSYMQMNPSITGVQSRAMNGAGGGVQWNMSKYFGVKMDLQGYMSTEWAVTVTSPLTINGKIVPVGTYKTNSTMFTYLFGPVVRFPAKRVVPFAEILFGGSNTNLYGSLYNQMIVGGASNEKSTTQHPFTMAGGGGIDIVVNKNVAFRIGEFDYVLTRYTNPFTDVNNQNHFRYQGGMVFRWGGE